MGTEQKNSICDSCANCNCSFQTGIYREKCDFYIPVKELGYAVVGIEHLRKYRQLQNNYEARLKTDMVAILDEMKDKIEDRLYKISDGSTYLDIEREFVRDEIFKIIDGYAESEE